MILSEEDRIVAVLKDIPIFCMNRIYKLDTKPWPWSSLIVTAYQFEFDNGYGASIIRYRANEVSGVQFELAVLGKDPMGHFGVIYDTGVTADIERGDAYYMYELLCKIEALSDDRHTETITVNS